MVPKTTKGVGLVLAVLALAVVAGVMAIRAFAGTNTYCNSCTISNTPAVGTTLDYTSNHSSTFQAKKQQIYYYEVLNGVTSGSVSSGNTQVLGLNHIGHPTTGPATARCHLLNDGTVTATCWADF